MPHACRHGRPTWPRLAARYIRAPRLRHRLAHPGHGQPRSARAPGHHVDVVDFRIRFVGWMKFDENPSLLIVWIIMTLLIIAIALGRVIGSRDTHGSRLRKTSPALREAPGRLPVFQWRCQWPHLDQRALRRHVAADRRFLTRSFQRTPHPPGRLTPLSRAQVDYTHFDAQRRYLREELGRVDFLINAAGFTGWPNVDQSEVEKEATPFTLPNFPKKKPHAPFDDTDLTRQNGKMEKGKAVFTAEKFGSTAHVCAPCVGHKSYRVRYRFAVDTHDKYFEGLA